GPKGQSPQRPLCQLRQRIVSKQIGRTRRSVNLSRGLVIIDRQQVLVFSQLWLRHRSRSSSEKRRELSTFSFHRLGCRASLSWVSAIDREGTKRAWREHVP